MKLLSSETETAIMSVVGRLYNGIYSKEARSVIDALRMAPEYIELSKVVAELPEGWVENKTIEEVSQETAERLRDLFALHAHIEDVKMAEDQLSEDIGAAGMADVDPLTLRIKARYLVAERMLRVRGES